MGKGVNRLNALVGNHDMATAIASTEIAEVLGAMKTNQEAHYAFQDSVAKAQLTVLNDILATLQDIRSNQR